MGAGSLDETPSSLSSSPPAFLSSPFNNDASAGNLAQVHVAAGNGAANLESFAARGGGGVQTGGTPEPQAGQMIGVRGTEEIGVGGGPIPLIRPNGGSPTTMMTLDSPSKHYHYSQSRASTTAMVAGSRLTAADPIKFPAAAAAAGDITVPSARGRLGRLMDTLLKIIALMLLGTFLLHVMFETTSGSGEGGEGGVGLTPPESSSSGISLLQNSAAARASTSSSSNKPRVLIVSASQSGCGTENGDNDIVKFLKNKADYSRLHGMDTWFSMELLVEPKFHRLRNKIALLRQIVRIAPKYDWFFWIDADAMFTDMAFEIPWARYRDRSVVILGSEKSLDTDPDYHESINMGVALLRNDAFTRALLDRILEFWEENSNQTEITERVAKRIKRLPPYVCDQGTVLYLLLTEREKWRRGFYFEVEYGLNRYWKEEAPNLEKYVEGGRGATWKGDGLSPPFITHFCGCSLCWKKVFDDFAECQLQYERAFTFANNQVIKPLGVKHRNLTSPEVVGLSEQ